MYRRYNNDHHNNNCVYYGNDIMYSSAHEGMYVL